MTLNSVSKRSKGQSQQVLGNLQAKNRPRFAQGTQFRATSIGMKIDPVQARYPPPMATGCAVDRIDKGNRVGSFLDPVAQSCGAPRSSSFLYAKF